MKNLFRNIFALFFHTKDKAPSAIPGLHEPPYVIENECIVPKNEAERELLRCVREIGMNGRLDIQYPNENAKRIGGKFLAVLPWPDSSERVNHGHVIELTEPKEDGTAMRTARSIRRITSEVAKAYNKEAMYTEPFLYYGGVLVMLFGFKE